MLLLCLAGILLARPAVAEEIDPFLWLEEIDGARSIDWAKAQNARTTRELESVSVYQPIHKRVLEILESKDRIPYFTFHHDYIYNYWQDAEHQRGVWRRTRLDSYRKDKPKWEVVIDIDRLAKTEGKPWAWHGAKCLEPSYRLCLVSLSRGGSDAVEVREFDTKSRRFVEGGFMVREAKSDIDWLDANSLWVATDFGPDSLTTSGYARTVRIWRRGRPLSTARTIFEGQSTDVSVNATTLRDSVEGRTYDLVTRTIAFWKSETYLRLDGRLVRLDIPQDATLAGIFKDQLLLTLRSDWTAGEKTYLQGALIAIGLDKFLAGSRAFENLFEPGERVSFGAVASTGKRLMLLTMDNVTSRLYRLTHSSNGWSRNEIQLPGKGSAELNAIDRERDLVSYTYTDYLTPTSLYLDDAGKTGMLKSTPKFFDTTGVKVEQLEAVSRDGTKIPYSLVTPRDFVADGNAPTLLYGYGGFEISLLPGYYPAMGAAWIERGGVYVVANIRGGGEFGPKWHQAAQGHAHMKNFDDFIAVAEDLQARHISSKDHLGIMGGSQGGLLVGGAFTLRPELFKAVVAQVPLSDMKRFNKLLAGASWMAEYGDPDKPEDWAFIKTWSPYELLRKDVSYPEAFYWTNTRDDRVHPAHARKMVAKMQAMEHPVYYFENMEGGHGSGTTSRQRAHVTALQYAYLWRLLR